MRMANRLVHLCRIQEGEESRLPKPLIKDWRSLLRDPEGAKRKFDEADKTGSKEHLKAVVRQELARSRPVFQG